MSKIPTDNSFRLKGFGKRRKMTGEEAFERLKAFVGRTLKQISDETGTELWIEERDRKNKGYLGTLLELILGKKRDSKQLPDFEDGTEVKKVSIVKGVRGYRVKETVKVTMINPSSALEPDFSKSHLFAKTRKILLIPTLYAGKGQHEREILLPPVLWKPTKDFDQELSKDYEEVVAIVNDEKKGFYTLSGRLGLRVQPRTNGSKNSTTRAFYLRTKTVKLMLGENYLSEIKF